MTDTKRAPSATDFTVSVEGLGDFTFARRTIPDALRIRGLFGQFAVNDADAELAGAANAYATVCVLCTQTPEGFGDFADYDLVADKDGLVKLFRVYEALVAKEDSFRQGAQKAGAGAG